MLNYMEVHEKMKQTTRDTMLSMVAEMVLLMSVKLDVPFTATQNFEKTILKFDKELKTDRENEL